MRDFDDPRWKKIRGRAFARDRYTCQFPGCKRKGGALQAHHIIRVADNPKLEFVLSNVVTVCVLHHNMVTGKEREYEALFRKVMGRKSKFRPRNPNLRLK